MFLVIDTPLLARDAARGESARGSEHVVMWGLGNIAARDPGDVRPVAMSEHPAYPSDEKLMEAFREGDARAFETLVARHGRGLFNFLFRSVRTTHRAEELLQEVLLRVVRSKHRYRRSARFTTWVYTIARNLTVDESRRARFRDHESLDAPPRGSGRGSGGEPGRDRLSRLASHDVPTDHAAEAPSLRRRLRSAIDELPEDQREVFLMRQVSGMSFREIGEIVGAPENTVKSRMRYALEKLRGELADLRDDAGMLPVRVAGRLRHADG
jgi:RNA polymerase sigma-70 factor (ECF subfamily)